MLELSLKKGTPMLKLTIKFTLLLLGFYIVSGNLSMLAIIALLCATSVSCFNQFFDNRQISFTTFLIYLVLCMVFPVFSAFLPIVAFDLLIDPRKRIIALAFPLPMLFALIYDVSFAGAVIPLLGASGVFAYVYDTRSRLNDKHNALRDYYAEVHLDLLQKNEELLDSKAQNELSATLQERNRIARDIHDNVGHSLTRGILQMAALKMLNRDETLSEQIDSLQVTLNKAMDEIRASVHDLSHASIDLQRSVEELFDEFSRNKPDVSRTIVCDIVHTAPSSVKYCFLMVIKEALTNIAKHSDANAIKVTLQEHPALFQLAIKDNGSAISFRRSDGIGLDSIKSRVHAIGGRCSFDQTSGFGIFVSIPKFQEENS